MRRITFILVLLPTIVFSQLLGENTLLLSSKASYVGVQFNAEANSNSINNSLLLTPYQRNKSLSNDELREGVEELNKNNFIGANTWVRLFYVKKLRRKPIQYYRLSFEYTDIISARISKDLLGLAVLGNKAYEDKNAAFTHNSFTNYNAQKIGFYVGKNLDKRTKLDAGISFLKGGRYQKMSSDKGNLYTAPYGEYLEGEVGFEYVRTPNKKAINFLGVGSSVDVHWSHVLKDTSKITLGVNDLGIMHWNATYISTLDSSFFFEGLVLDNIFDTINLSTRNISPDSLESVFGVQTKKRGRWSTTPFTIFANYQRKIHSKVIVSLGVQHTFGTASLPLVTLIPHYTIKKGFSIYPMLSYGGFGSYNIGLGANTELTKNLNLRVQSRFLDGMIRYSSKGGQGVFLSLIYKL